jgi:hypothetical protein
VGILHHGVALVRKKGDRIQFRYSFATNKCRTVVTLCPPSIAGFTGQANFEKEMI